MAGKRLSIALTLNDKQFQSALRKATRSMTKFGKSMQRTGQTLSKSLTLPVLAFGAASVKAFDEQIKAETKLRTALKGDERAFENLTKQATEFQKVSLFGDEQIITQQAYLASLGMTEETINKVIAASLDLAAGTGQTLEFGVKNLAKTFAGLTGELGESIPALKELTKEELMLGGAVDVVSEAFAGQALELTKVGLGPFEQLKMVLSDVSEEFGKLILENIEPLKTSLQGLASNLRNLSTEQKKTIIKIAGLTAVVGPLLIVFGKLVTVLTSIGKALIFLAANPMVIFATAISTLVGLLGFAILDMEGFLKTALNLGKVGRLTAKAIIMFADATGLMSKPQAIAAIATIDGMSKEQEKLAQSMEGTTTNIEEQKTAIDNLIESMGKMPTPSNGNGMQSTGMLNFEPIAAGPLPLSEDALDTTPLESYSAGLTDLQIKMQDTANSFERAFHSMAVSADSSFGDIAAAAANAARQVIKSFVAEAIAGHLKTIFATVPFPFNLALASAAGSVVGSIFNKVIPPFADGGMVSGATLAMVGEGPGTSAINPEVIAPLDKLQGMIGNAGGQVEVFGRLRGSDILLSSDRARGNRNRTRGY
jgi:hypothetical protein